MQGIISIISKGLVVGGTIYGFFGAIGISNSMKDANGPGLNSAVWQLVGGIIIIALGVYFATIDLSI